MKQESEFWTFRPSRPDDLERMYAVWHASVLATHDFLTKADFKDICEAVRRDYLPNNAATVAVADGDIVGFMECADDEIVSLFIHPTHSSQGLGRAFVNLAISQPPSLDVTVNAQNIQAVGFYERMGFVAFAEAPVDDDGRPVPIIRMRRVSEGSHRT